MPGDEVVSPEDAKNHRRDRTTEERLRDDVETITAGVCIASRPPVETKFALGNVPERRERSFSCHNRKRAGD